MFPRPGSLALGLLLLSLPLASGASGARNGKDEADKVCTALAPQLAKDRATFLYDHARDKAFLVVDGACRAKERDDEFRIAKPLDVKVINTNTAFYGFGVTTKKVEAPEIKDLKAFTKALGPYLAELGTAIFRAPGPYSALAAGALPEPEWKKVANEIQKLLYGSEKLGGLYGTANRIDQALEEMRGIEVRQAAISKSDDAGALMTKIDADLTDITSSLKGDVVRPRDPMKEGDRPFREKEADEFQLTTIDKLLEKFRELSEAADKVTPIPPDAKKLLDARLRIMTLAYQVEALGLSALGAKTFSPPRRPVEVSASSGRAVTLKVTPSSAEEVARVAARGPKEFSFTAQPDWLIRPALGLGFLAATKAVYPKFSTTKAGDGVKIVSTASQDSRFTYGLTLGLTWRGLDDRDGSGFAVWAPELIVNPSSDVKAVGVGIAVSWSVVKIGAGALWTKHTTLDGQSFGDPLATADDLKTKDAYGAPKFFVSLSVFGWPPFVQ